ncbi:MAG TPA: YitT family protein [Candidatus Onthousia faecigallinarum]|nr:YitT family protein [Candidatus Onthousia faecigallinarum]
MKENGGRLLDKIKRHYGRYIRSFFFLTIGAILAAYALEAFLIPNTILDGGVTGVSTILTKVTGVPLSFFILILNIPFVCVGYLNLGRGFLVRTVYSMLLFSVCLTLFNSFEPITDQMLLATVFGGALLGIGVGLVIHFGGCVDGTESVAIVISKKSPFSVGQVVLVFNLIIYTVAGLIFGFDRAMYSLLTYFITFRVIDFVSEGMEQAKAALIITDHGENLAAEIYKRLGRTVTFIQGNGLISGEKEVLYCVLTRIEIFELRHLVEEMDDSAFVTILEVSEIIGEHIKSTQKINTVQENVKN